MPDLADFIAQYATPYVPATDTYRRPPFASLTKARISGLDDVHSYHTRVPPQGIEPYIKHYTDLGDLVLDPFCGSGTTGVAALRLVRRVILNDLAPAATHISRNYCTAVLPTALQREFQSLLQASSEELDWLYKTECDRCGEPAEIQYTIWSDVFECGRCGAELTLWDLAVDEEAQVIHDKFNCPNCEKNWSKSELRRLRAVPVITNYECATCSPKRSEHRTTHKEIDRINEIASAGIPYWYPKTEFNQDFEMWRRVHADLKITDSSKFFTPRNLRAFARLWQGAELIEDQAVRDRIRFTLTGSVPSLTIMTMYMPDRSGRGNRKGTLYVPSLSIEQNVKRVVLRRFRRVLNYAEQFRGGDVSVRTGTATKLQEIPDSTIDYVFTDPPFGSNIFYADVNFLWESWLGELTDQSQEAVVHIKHKAKNTLPDYTKLMTQSFQEIRRVLKPGRWASVVFHNSDDQIWQAILGAVDAAGLELAEINSFDKSHLSFKGIKGAQGLERVTNKDIVLNLRKPGPDVARASGNTTTTARNGDAEARVVQQLADFLGANPAHEQRTLQHFWNVVLHEMLANGVVEVSMEQVSDLLPYYFKQVDGKWYLRGEAVVGGNVFDLKSDAGALTWLNAVLSEPHTTGDLIPKWQAAIGRDVDPGRLERLLEQNFWLDKRSGRWRTPTDIERATMNATQDLAAEAHLRVIRKYLAGQSDHQPHNRELAEWVRFAYHREAYAEAVALYAHLDEGPLEPEFAKSLRKIVAVCKLKTAATAP